MKLNCGLSKQERRARQRERCEIEAARLRNWHKWFAWFPVRVGHKDCRWLETVERRMEADVYGGLIRSYYVYMYDDEYRALK